MNASILARALSKILMLTGALAFFFGDRALREIWHFRFASAELIGIGSGLVLMVLGGILQTALNREISRRKATGTSEAHHVGSGSETS